MATDPTNDAGQQRDERADDEDISEFFDTTWRANVKEGYDVFRGDDRWTMRTLVHEYLRGVRNAERAAEEERGVRLRQQEEMHQQYLRHTEEMFTSRQRDQHQSLAHRDLAIAQQWRDQARDSGESVFKPTQSS